MRRSKTSTSVARTPGAPAFIPHEAAMPKPMSAGSMPVYLCTESLSKTRPASLAHELPPAAPKTWSQKVSMPTVARTRHRKSPRVQLEPLEPSVLDAPALLQGAGKTIFDRKSPRTLRSFLANYLADDFGSFKNDIDLQRHQQESGQPTTNVTVQECCDLNPSVRSLNISRCNMVTDVGLWAVARYCTALRELKMAGCERITHIGLRALSLRCGNLDVLDLHDCPQVDDGSLRVLAGGCWKLKNLNLQRCQGVSDAGIAELALMCTMLQVLNVSECKRVGEYGDKALLEIGRSCNRLRQLDLFGCKHVRDAGIRAMASGCHELRTLKLTGCVDVTGAAVRALAKGCMGLKSLSLSGCEKIKNRDLWVLASACSGLTWLDISGSPNIKAKGIQALTEHCQQLTYLNISKCEQISDAATDLMSKRCSGLQFLNLAGCPRMTEGGVDRLCKCCTRLFSLNVTDNPRISRSYLQTLVSDLLFVEWAHSYVGFQPKPDAEELMKRRELFLLQTNAATQIQKVMRGCLSRGGLYAVKFNWIVKHVLPVIQARIRGFLARKHLAVKIDRRNRRRATLKIQRVYRGFKGRERARIRRRVLLIQDDEGQAALIFQKIYRGHVDRVKVRHMREAITKEKMLAARREALENLAAIKVQQRWRGHKSASEVALLHAAREAARIHAKERDAAARRMQTLYRGKLGRQAAMDRRAQLAHERQRQAAAMSLQRTFRGHQGRALAAVERQREQHEMEEHAALMLQMAWRGMRGRHFAAMMRSLWQLRQREELAAGRIQRVWRGRQGRKAYEQVKRAMLEKQRKERACVQMQRMYRGHAGRTDAEVKRALRGLETDAAPLLKKIAMDEARLRAAAAELAESDRILGAEKEDEEKLTEELELVKLTKTKYHDSARITGHPQRFLTRFLAMRLAEQLTEKRAEVQIETEANDELFRTVKGLEKEIRAARRELAPMQGDISDTVRTERSARLRAQVRGQHQAAMLIQRVYRGYRVREAVRWKANYWEERLDDLTGEIYFYHKFSKEERRTYPIRPLDMLLFEAPQRNPNWDDAVDQITGFTYYYNKLSEEFRWERPDDFEGVNLSAALGAGVDESGIEWFEDQDPAALASRSVITRQIGYWQETKDNASGRTFYLCAATGDLKWSLPPRTAHRAPRVPVVESEDDEYSDDEDKILKGGDHVHELLMEWGIPEELREDALTRPTYYNLKGPQMEMLVKVWDGDGKQDFTDLVDLELGLKLPAALEAKIKLVNRMYVPFFQRAMMMSEVEEACGEQDWDRAMAISQQILEMQREAGERPPDMMIMPDDSEEVQSVLKHIEEEEEDFEQEMVVAERRSQRRAQGLPSESEEEAEEEDILEEVEQEVPMLQQEGGSTTSTDWQEVEAEDGSTYYWNSATNETSWERPAQMGVEAAVQLAAGWELVDDGAGSQYYYNQDTGQSSWDRPE